MPLTKRATRLVLPTPNEPSMQIFFWIMCSSLPGFNLQRHTAICLQLMGCRTVPDRLAVAQPGRRQHIGRDAPLQQSIANTLGALLAQLDILALGAGLVGAPVNLE